MRPRAPIPSADSAGSQAEHLCDLMLQIVGKNTGRMGTARRHVEVLQAAMPHMTPAQIAIAQDRIDGIETKWGGLLPREADEPETDDIPPEMRVARWLSTRRSSERLLRVLYRAATFIWDGETCISDIMDHAFAKELDHVIMPCGQDSFTEWMLELRIARRTAPGVYQPGKLCEWWVKEMVYTRPRKPSYKRCLADEWSIRFPGMKPYRSPRGGRWPE